MIGVSDPKLVQYKKKIRVDKSILKSNIKFYGPLKMLYSQVIYVMGLKSTSWTMSFVCLAQNNSKHFFRSTLNYNFVFYHDMFVFPHL